MSPRNPPNVIAFVTVALNRALKLQPRYKESLMIADFDL